MTTDSTKLGMGDGRPRRSPTGLQGDIVMDRNCHPGRRDACPVRDERESRSSASADSRDVRFPINERSTDNGRECLDKTQVQPALMLRQLAFAMRISRALYAAAQLGISDLLANGPM